MEIIIVLLVLGLIGYMIMKEYNATVMLLAGGMILLFSAAILGHPIFDVSESSGLVAFYSFIVLIPAIAEQSGANAIAIALPMQLFSNLVRSISPVSAVVIIVASIIKVSPMEVVKRTSVPIILSMIVCIVLSIVMFGI
ncbi:MAG: hypothetical protein WCS30_10250 [Selenomonadaceae bacterium]